MFLVVVLLVVVLLLQVHYVWFVLLVVVLLLQVHWRSFFLAIAVLLLQGHCVWFVLSYVSFSCRTFRYDVLTNYVTDNFSNTLSMTLVPQKMNTEYQIM